MAFATPSTRGRAEGRRGMSGSRAPRPGRSPSRTWRSGLIEQKGKGVLAEPMR
ncbi:hypothetical protein C791_7451 [Amycolatopsis azurea DSM 43854]|uniref:Uncharacterized protein n=1 Tax=Amycolatopsis azurea DSM 43854 TaxID=1238180 RepID=M2Q947_9PSEU|nr:hypothetical protein C791_7451 [Amycolatopsis azurea DSM 43854]